MSEEHGSASGRDEDALPRFLEGYLLISEIGLLDPNFYRSVILVVTHDENGAFGLVVNRPAKLTAGELLEGMDGSPAASIPVYVGGPLQQDFLFLLHSGLPESVSGSAARGAAEGVIFEPASQPVVDYLKTEWGKRPEAERPDVRLYAGYSGWGPGQLESELKRESWVVLRSARGIVFHPNPAEGWSEALAKKGPLYQIILQTGFKPSAN